MILIGRGSRPTSLWLSELPLTILQNAKPLSVPGTEQHRVAAVYEPQRHVGSTLKKTAGDTAVCGVLWVGRSLHGAQFEVHRPAWGRLDA